VKIYVVRWLSSVELWCNVTLFRAVCAVLYGHPFLAQYWCGKSEYVLNRACQTEGPPRAMWVTFVLSWGPRMTCGPQATCLTYLTQYVLFIHNVFYTCKQSIIFPSEKTFWIKKSIGPFFCERRAFIQFKL
jgi:hypothetical protein